MIVVSVETGGLKSEIHPLLKIDALNVEMKQLFTVRIKAYAQCEPKAMEINQLDPNEGVSLEEARDLAKFFIGDEFIFAGHNLDFQLKFLKKAGILEEGKVFKGVDLMALAKAKGFPLKRDALAKHLGVETENRSKLDIICEMLAKLIQ